MRLAPTGPFNVADMAVMLGVLFFVLVLIFLIWCVLLVLCWPLALLALILWPLVWLISLPFRLVGITLEAVFALLRAALFLPARVLGYRPPRSDDRMN